MVVGVFLLALLIPLQLALNQLTEEFNARQAISRAQTVFDVADRSTVLNSAFTIDEDGVNVRLQVATNELFRSRTSPDSRSACSTRPDGAPGWTWCRP